MSRRNILLHLLLYFEMFILRLGDLTHWGKLRNIPSSLGWGSYVTNAQFSGVGELRNFPHPSTRAHLGGGITALLNTYIYVLY